MKHEEDCQAACRERALLLLSHRPHSAGELVRKLVRKGFPRPHIDEIAQDFLRTGLLDDAAFARAFCEQRLHGSRPLGRARLRAELGRRYVDRDIANQAMEEVFAEAGDDAEYGAALATARPKWRSLSRRAGRDARQKRDSLYRFLAGRGFAAGICRRVVDELRSSGTVSELPTEE